MEEIDRNSNHFHQSGSDKIDGVSLIAFLNDSAASLNLFFEHFLTNHPAIFIQKSAKECILDKQLKNVLHKLIVIESDLPSK